MSKRSIIIEPDPILRRESSPIEQVDDELRNLLDEMLKTMYSASGIGLAAVQIGILKRLIPMRLSLEFKFYYSLVDKHLANSWINSIKWDFAAPLS